MLIAEHDYDFIILGTPAFTGYYVYHNMENRYMEFTPLKGTLKPRVTKTD